MIETTRICIGISLFLLSVTLILHLIAMNQHHWKIYEHRNNPSNTLIVGIFRRCEIRLIPIASNTAPTSHSICDDNKYCFQGNENCTKLANLDPGNLNLLDDMQNHCNMNDNPYHCNYSSAAKGLISCTIIAACTLGISLLLIFSHILINQFKYKIHMYIAMITIPLLFLGFLFILITLILFGSTINNDLYQYRYNLDYRFNSISDNARENFRKNIIERADNEYDVRLDWAGGLEIGALISSSITLVTQIIYLISTYRNRIG